MASVKDSFGKAFGYILSEIRDLKRQRAELREYISYFKGKKTYIAIREISRKSEAIEQINEEIKTKKNEIRFYVEYFKYTKEDMKKYLRYPSKAELQADWQAIQKEQSDDTWTSKDHEQLMKRVRELDISLGRINPNIT